MHGYTLGLSCPYCGCDVAHEAGGKSNGWETRAVARCSSCRAQLVIQVSMVCTNSAQRVKK